MNDIIKQWFTENAMGRMFQLSELNRQTGVYFNVVGNVVTFNARGSQHPIAQELDGKILYIDTLEEVPAINEIKTLEAPNVQPPFLSIKENTNDSKEE